MQKIFDEISIPAAKNKTQNTLKTIGKNIKRLRIEGELSQGDTAFFIFGDKSMISSLERGSHKNITLLTLIKIATLFDVEVEDLLKES